MIGKREGTWNFLLSRLTESPNDRALRGKMATCRDFISDAAYDEKDETSIASTTFDLRLPDRYRLDPQSNSQRGFSMCAKKFPCFMISHKKDMSYENKKKEIPKIVEVTVVVLAYDSPNIFKGHLNIVGISYL